MNRPVSAIVAALLVCLSFGALLPVFAEGQGPNRTHTRSQAPDPSCAQNLPIGDFTLCGEVYNDISTGTNVTVEYSPTPNNAIIAWATWCFTSACDTSISDITATIGDNVNATESCFVASPHSPFITDGNGGGQGSGDFQQHYVWYCPSIPAGVTSFTVTPNNSSLSFLQLNISEWKAGSLAPSCSPVSACFENVDNFAEAGNPTGGTTATITTSGPTVHANDLLFAVTEVPCCSFTASPGPGYTGITVAPSVTPGMVSEAEAATAAGTQTATTTWSGGNAAWFGVIVPVVGAAQVTVSAQNVQLLITGTNETSPNAVPIQDAGFGSSPQNCTFSQSSNPNGSCYNPLEIALDFNIPQIAYGSSATVTQPNLGGSGLDSVLFDTNSSDALEGEGTYSLSMGCDTNGNISSFILTVTMDDGSAFKFTATNNPPCTFSQQQSIVGTFNASEDAGDFAVAYYPAISGSYQGSFQSSDGSNGGTATINNIQTNSDFSVSASASIPQDSLCREQTITQWSTTDPLISKNDLLAYAVGDAIVLPMADSESGANDITWLTASDIDLTTGDPVSWPSQLYFSAYNYIGVCANTTAWDALFTRIDRSPEKPPRIIRWPQRPLIPHRWRRDFILKRQDAWKEKQEMSRIWQFVRISPY